MSLALLADAAIKATILLGFLFALSGVLRRAPAALRHLVWAVGLTAVLVLPILSLGLPWRLEIVPLGAAGEPAIERTESPARDVGTATGESDLEEAASDIGEDAPGGAHPGEAIPSDRTELPASMPTERAPMRRAERDLEPGHAIPWGGDPGRLILLGWLLGLALVAGRLLMGMLFVRGITGRGAHLDSGKWKRLRDRAALRLNIGGRVRLIMSARAPVPFGTGLFRPTVVVPRSAEGWSDERRLAVLMHEMAHLRRRDFLAHLIAQAACAVYWFHPLVWMAARRLRVESERACDDLVLCSGTRPSRYAQHLIEIVRSSGRSWALTAAQPMARRSEFEGRLLAILEPDVKRQGPGPRSALSVVLAIAVTAIPLAAMGPERPRSADISEPQPVQETAIAAPPIQKEAAGGELAEGDANRSTFDSTPTEGVDLVEESAAEAAGQAPEITEPTGAAGPEPATSQESPVDRVGALLGALDDPESAVRSTVVRALGQLQDTLAMRALMTAVREDSDSEVREAAAWALGEMEDARAIPALEDALAQDGVASVRVMAARALGEIEDPRAIGALGRAVEDSDPAVRQAAIRALGEIESPDAIDALAAGLEYEDAGTRKLAVWALGEIEDARAIPALSQALRSDPDAEVRRGAARGLGEIEHRSAVEALGAALSDEDERVRAMAVWALGEIEDPTAVAPLTRVLEEDGNPEIRARAVRALGEIEDRRAVEPLLAALNDANAEVRALSAWALGEIEDAAATEGLAAALGDAEIMVRERAALALAELDLASAPEPLIAALADGEAKVRLAAVLALGEIEDPAAVPALANLLDDPEVKVRRLAVRALGEIESPEAYRVLVQALEDEDPEIRKSAARALGEGKNRWRR